jgi:hypothetical protein
MKRLILCSAVALSVSACITKPPRAEQIRQPPAERLLTHQAVSDGDSTIVVTRDVGMSGSGCYLAVFIDGVVAAKLGTGERARFYVPSGDHVLGTWNTGAALCGYREGKDRKEVSVSLKPGDIRKFRITLNPNAGNVELNPTTLE